MYISNSINCSDLKLKYNCLKQKLIQFLCGVQEQQMNMVYGSVSGFRQKVQSLPAYFTCEP